uniref:Uncharacterized protein n=1 Tax=Arundo donax TaxID=35708 RepID=A0A0A9D3S4_ARUDO
MSTHFPFIISKAFSLPLKTLSYGTSILYFLLSSSCNSFCYIVGMSLNKFTTLSAIQLFVTIVSPHLLTKPQVCFGPFLFTLHPGYFLLVDAKNTHLHPF